MTQQPTARKPTTFDEAFTQATLTPEEEAELNDGKFQEAESLSDSPARAPSSPFTGSLSPEGGRVATGDQRPVNGQPDGTMPEWVIWPEGLRVPPHRQVSFLLFRAQWTDRPDLGDRHCIVWSLSDADEKFAIKRTRGDSVRGLSELSKQMVRAFDGKVCDWTKSGKGGDVDKFWDQIGPKCRQILQTLYVETHSMKQNEREDFFRDCIVTVTSAPK